MHEGALNANIKVCSVVSLKMLSINEIDNKLYLKSKYTIAIAPVVFKGIIKNQQ